MDEADAVARARHGEVGRAFRVDFERQLPLGPGWVHCVVSREVEHEVRTAAAKKVIQGLQIGDGYLVVRNAGLLPDQPHQLRPELAAGPKHYRVHKSHTVVESGVCYARLAGRLKGSTQHLVRSRTKRANQQSRKKGQCNEGGVGSRLGLVVAAMAGKAPPARPTGLQAPDSTPP